MGQEAGSTLAGWLWLRVSSRLQWKCWLGLRSHLKVQLREDLLLCSFTYCWWISVSHRLLARDMSSFPSEALYFLLVIKFHYQHFNYHLYVDTCLLDLCLQPTLVRSDLYIYSHMPNECCNGMPKTKSFSLRSFKIYPFPQIFVNDTILNSGGQTKNQVLSSPIFLSCQQFDLLGVFLHYICFLHSYSFFAYIICSNLLISLLILSPELHLTWKI